MNSSPTFKGYYYQGTDTSYHYFKAKWSLGRNHYFKIRINDLDVHHTFIFNDIREQRIDVFNLGHREFARNEYCRLYFVLEKNTLKNDKIEAKQYFVYPACLTTNDKIDGMSINEIYEVDVKPEFKGGDIGLFKCILDNLEYPKESLNECIQTYLQVCFVIDTAGHVRNACILNPLNKESYTKIENDLIKVIENLPKWKPAMKEGNYVPCIYTLPVHIEVK